MVVAVHTENGSFGKSSAWRAFFQTEGCLATFIFKVIQSSEFESSQTLLLFYWSGKCEDVWLHGGPGLMAPWTKVVVCSLRLQAHTPD